MSNSRQYLLPTIQDQQLLKQALTHRSYVNENVQCNQHNERLEFLGDAVLGFLVGDLLYRFYPDLSEAELTRLRSRLVDEQQFSKIAVNMNLGKMIRLGQGAIKNNGRSNPALLSDTFEAIIGAYFLDAGIKATAEFIKPIFKILAEELTVELEQSQLTSFIDPKTNLQQWSLGKYQEVPQYQIIAESGLDHEKRFIAQVLINGKIYGHGEGSRKKEAEKNAAQTALEFIELNCDSFQG